MRVLCIVVGCVALLAGLAAGAQATFAPQVDYVAGTPNGVPRSVHLGDFNGDGNIDLLVLNQDADDVAILLGNGDGTFRPAQVFPVGNTPAGAVVLDLDGDGRLDVVVANFGSNDISVLLGNGDGTLRPQVRIPLSGGPSAVVAGDFDGDGKVDIAVTLRSAGGVATFFGNGDGTFRRGVTLVTDDSPFFPVTADFNGDGRSDLAVATFSKHGVAIFLGQGDGTFAPQQVYVIAGATVAGLVVGDFNDDGHLDIATANTTPATVAILLGNGDGTFQAPVTWPANGSLFIAATDLDRDGIPDLAVTANAGGRLAILRGVGDGTFAPPAFVGNTAITFGIAAADFDGDGRIDLAIADRTGTDSVGILINTTPVVPLPPTGVTAAAGNAQATVAFAPPTDRASQPLADFTVRCGTFSATGATSPIVVSGLSDGVAYTCTVTARNANGSSVESAPSNAITPLAPSLVAVVASVTPVLVGSPVTFTATVTGASPTGVVAFKVGGTPVEGCDAVTLSNASAQCTTSFPSAGLRTVTAEYPGDAANAPGVGTIAGGELVVLNPTSLALVTSAAAVAVGEPAIFTATLTGPNPGGTVAFLSDGVTIPACATEPMAAGVARCETAFLVPGSHVITAQYSGDSVNATSSGALAAAIVVNPAATFVTIATSDSPVTVGTPVKFTAQVTGNAPTGTITFRQGTTVIAGCGGVTLVGAIAHCTTSFATSGVKTVLADYSGDGANLPATGALPGGQVVNGVPSILALATSTSPVNVLAPVTFTATVTGAAPTGTIAFLNAGTAIAGCAAVPLASAIARCTTSFSGAGIRTITAAYAGDDVNAASTGTLAGGQSVVKASTAMSLATSAPSVAAGVAVTFTVVITGSNPTGSVDFMSDGTAIPGCGAVPVAAGNAQCVTSFPAPGTRLISAGYPGDAVNAAASVALAGGQAVTPAVTSVTLSTSPSPVTVLAPVTFTAAVAGVAPTGNVTFREAGSAIDGCIAIPLIAGRAHCTAHFATAGTKLITADYSGDGANHPASGVLSGGEVVTLVPTVLLLATSAPAVPVGVPVVFTASVTGSSPTGTVRFASGGVTISGCGAEPVIGGSADCETAFLAAGTMAITAEYSGDAVNAPSAATLAGGVSVTAAATFLVIATSASPVTVGTPVTFTASVAGNAPTGTVTFRSGGSVIAGCAAAGLASARAQCTASFTTAGVKKITADYPGDGANAAVTGTLSGGQVVNAAPSSVALTTSASPVAVRAGVTFTATVSGGSPTGTVTFRDGAAAIAGCNALPLAGTRAQCATSFTSPGTKSIAADYSGDAANASSSGTLAGGEVVTAAAASVALATSASPVNVGAVVLFTATVTGASPTGAVTFRSGGTPITGCVAVTMASAAARCTATFLTPGTKVITADYPGDAENLPASGTLAGGEVVNAGTTRVSVTTSASPVNVGAAVTFTTTVAATSPTGSVIFSSGDTPIEACDAVTLVSGRAQCTTSFPTPGTKVVTADYSGDAVNAPATGTLAGGQVVVDPHSFTGPTATGTGVATISFTGGGPDCAFALSQSAFFIGTTGHAKSPPPLTDPPTAFPHGLVDFVLTGCTPAAAISFTIRYPSVLPPQTQYWKYGPTPSNPAPHWYVLPAAINGDTVTFSIVDGGLGDDDLTVNGNVVDQGGAGVPAGTGAAQQIPTLSEWALVLLAAALVLVAGMRRRR